MSIIKDDEYYASIAGQLESTYIAFSHWNDNERRVYIGFDRIRTLYSEKELVEALPAFFESIVNQDHPFADSLFAFFRVMSVVYPDESRPFIVTLSNWPAGKLSDFDNLFLAHALFYVGMGSLVPDVVSRTQMGWRTILDLRAWISEIINHPSLDSEANQRLIEQHSIINGWVEEIGNKHPAYKSEADNFLHRDFAERCRKVFSGCTRGFEW